MGFGDAYAQSYKNGRAIAFLVLIAGVIVYFVLSPSHGEVVATSRQMGSVLEMKTRKMGDSVSYIVRVNVEGEEMMMMLPSLQRMPKVGDQLPLVKQRYEDDHVTIRFDGERWFDMGSQ